MSARAQNSGNSLRLILGKKRQAFRAALGSPQNDSRAASPLWARIPLLSRILSADNKGNFWMVLGSQPRPAAR